MQNNFLLNLKIDFENFISEIENYLSTFIFISKILIIGSFLYIKEKLLLLKKWSEKNLIWLLIISFLIILLIGTNVTKNISFKYQLQEKEKTIFCLKLKIQDWIKKYKYEYTKRQVELKIIDEKVNNMQTYISKIYPGFDYKKKIDEAIKNPEYISSIPEELMSLYIQEKWIKPHGIQNYDLTLKKCIFPLRKGAFTANKDSEYATPRPYKYFGYMHEGWDAVNPFDNSVLAIYDAVVWKKEYNEGGGWTLEIKFLYEWEDGTKQWAFSRFRHMEEIYVNVGDKVKQGDVLAQMGDTGFYAIGKHLHWELYLWEKGKYVNYNPVQNSTWKNKIREKLW